MRLGAGRYAGGVGHLGLGAAQQLRAGGGVVAAIARTELLRDSQPMLHGLVPAVRELRADVLDLGDDPADRAELAPVLVGGADLVVAALGLEVRERGFEDAGGQV